MVERDNLLAEQNRLGHQQQLLALECKVLVEERDSLVSSFRKKQGELYVLKTDLS